MTKYPDGAARPSTAVQVDKRSEHLKMMTAFSCPVYRQYRGIDRFTAFLALTHIRFLQLLRLYRQRITAVLPL